MTTTTKLSLLLSILSCVHGFNVGQNRAGLPRSRTNMPPLYYTDIEPEISAITINPEITFNGTSLFINNDENVLNEQLNLSKTATRKTRTTKTRSIKASSPTKQQKKKQEAKKGNNKIRWEAHYNELKTYAEQNGNTLVPQKYKHNPKLGYWVMQQRRQYALQQEGSGQKRSSFNGPEGERRRQLLEDIGFVWRVGRRGPIGAYGELRRMKLRSDNNGEKFVSGDEIIDAVDFEKFMIERSDGDGGYSEEDKVKAWRRRFELFR